MDDHRIEIGRRRIIKCGVGIAGASALGLALASRNAAAKAPQGRISLPGSAERRQAMRRLQVLFCGEQ